MSTGLKVGAGRAVIKYTDEMFPNFKENYTHVHDDSYVDVVLMEQDGQKFALLAAGTVALAHPKAIAEMISQTAEVPEDRIIISAKHVLSAPHANAKDTIEHILDISKKSGKEISLEEAEGYVARNKMMIEAIHAASKEACEAAKASVKPVTMRFAMGHTDVNCNRLTKTYVGWEQGHNPDIPADGTLPVLRFDDEGGNAVAILFFCNVAPGVLENSFLADGRRPASGDMAAETERRLDAQYEGAVCIYMTGATGDHWQALRALHDTVDRDGNQTITDLHEAGFIFIDVLSDRLKEAVIRAAEASEEQSTEAGINFDRFIFTYPGQKTLGKRGGHDMRMTSNVDLREEMRQHKAEMKYVQEGEIDLGLDVLRIGADTAVLFIGVEINSGTWKKIRENSPFKNTMIVEFSNLNGGGYLPEKDYYEKVTHQSTKTRYAAGSAERLTDDVLAALNKLAGK